MSDKEFLDMLDEMIRYPKPVIKLEWVIRLMAMNAEKDKEIAHLTGVVTGLRIRLGLKATVPPIPAAPGQTPETDPDP